MSATDQADHSDVMNSLTEKVCDGGGGFEDEETAAEIQFFPPLYIQRYSLALRFLTEHRVKSVIDFGCAECSFFKLLPTLPDVEHVTLVDIDRELLERKKRAISPEIRHFINRRAKPLHVSLLAGSAADMDRRVQGYEAVTMIEVIEHMHLDVLEKVTDNVFGKVRPRLCIVTTPNSEFNVLFENSDPTQFRHWDHKFEWTRQQFRHWCSRICEMHGYSVEYTGVGQVSSKPESAHLGPCSQAAVFIMQKEKWQNERLQGTELVECYELIAESDFPYREDVSTLEEKIDLEVLYILRNLIQAHEQDSEPGETLEIPVSHIAAYFAVKALCDEDGVRESVIRNSYKLSPDRRYVVIDPEEDSENDFFGDEYDCDHKLEENLPQSIQSDSQWEADDPDKSRSIALQDSGTDDTEEDWNAACS